MTQPAATSTCLVDVVFPGDTNHHGTLFGGVGLAHMDKVAFITAARFGRADFVTASCEQIDFQAPCQLGDIIELQGRVIRKGRRSVAIQVTLHAEAPLSGERRSCGQGLFHMVAVGDTAPAFPAIEPPAEGAQGGLNLLRMVDLVFPGAHQPSRQPLWRRGPVSHGQGRLCGGEPPRTAAIDDRGIPGRAAGGADLPWRGDGTGRRSGDGWP